MSRSKKPQPTWAGVKTKLTAFDRAGLLGLIQDLYGASKDNQAFLHARLNPGDDVLKPYKMTIDRWLWPDARRPSLLERLDEVRRISHNFGYGVGDDMDAMLAKYEADD